jgi:hypothetical protein
MRTTGYPDDASVREYAALHDLTSVSKVIPE